MPGFEVNLMSRPLSFRCQSRRPTGRPLVCAVAGAAMMLAFAPSAAKAQIAPPVITPLDYSAPRSGMIALTDIGSNFLRRLGKEATWGYNVALGSNPNGGGASESMTNSAVRTWAEGYGLGARTNPQGDFVGDTRSTVGGVAGLGVTLAPGFNVNISIDQSRTKIDVPLAFQTGMIDLTQLGIVASYTSGAWTIAGAAVQGFGRISTNRDTGFGFATSGYSARVTGFLGELSYYYGIGDTRIVPKANIEYVRGSTATMQETGGLEPISAGPTFAERARVMFGAEVGRYWIFDQKVLDLSAYAKFVDNFHQYIAPVAVSAPFSGTITVQGIRESTYGTDFGSSASLTLTRAARIYLNYDGKYRASNSSHQGTLGLELKW